MLKIHLFFQNIHSAPTISYPNQTLLLGVKGLRPFMNYKAKADLRLDNGEGELGRKLTEEQNPDGCPVSTSFKNFLVHSPSGVKFFQKVKYMFHSRSSFMLCHILSSGLKIISS